MGNNCLQATLNTTEFAKIYKQAFLVEYCYSSWPQDEDLQNQLKLSNIYTQNNTIAPLKHKLYERWFWGMEQDGRPYAKGILFNKFGKNSIYYEGQFNGEPKGLGKVVYNGGEWEYIGEIDKGKANGKGNFINNKQAFKFDGEWKSSKPQTGQLTLFSNFSQTDSPHQTRQIHGNVIVQLTNFSESNTAVITYPDGKIYTGEINKVKFTPEGTGKIVFPNQTKYVGEWNDGEMHGEGKFQWNDGSSYEGEYKFGKKHGKGKFRFTCGNYYEGFWLNGKQDGKGILYDDIGNQLQNGDWKAGIFKGKPHLSQ